MISQISYFLLLGLPLIYWLGIIALALLVAAAMTQLLARKKIIPPGIKWHKRLAVAGISIGFVHGLLGLLNYL